MITVIIELNDDECDFTRNQIENRISAGIAKFLPDVVVMHLEASPGDMKTVFGVERFT